MPFVFFLIAEDAPPPKAVQDQQEVAWSPPGAGRTLNFNWSEIEGTKTQETHRYTSRLDWFVSKSLFVTVPDYE